MLAKIYTQHRLTISIFTAYGIIYSQALLYINLEVINTNTTEIN